MTDVSACTHDYWASSAAIAMRFCRLGNQKENFQADALFEELEPRSCMQNIRKPKKALITCDAHNPSVLDSSSDIVSWELLACWVKLIAARRCPKLVLRNLKLCLLPHADMNQTARIVVIGAVEV